MFHIPVDSYTYRTDPILRLFVARDNRKRSQRQPAILFFHGAGFSTNQVTPSQFQHHAAVFASLGMRAICVEYRPAHVEGRYSPMQCLSHARSAIHWVRQHADALAIHPDQITAAGASAGGFLALCCAVIEEVDSIRSKPDACILFNAGVDAGPLLTMFPAEADALEAVSPVRHVRSELPPSLFFHGTADQNIPHEQVARFVQQLQQYGNDSTLISFPELGHGFFRYGEHGNVPYKETMEASLAFLQRLYVIGSNQ